MASRVVEPTGSFWLISVFQTQTRCGHLICNAFRRRFLSSKLTNLRLSSENSSPENFLSSSPPDTPFIKKPLCMSGFFMASRVVEPRFVLARKCFSNTNSLRSLDL